LQRQQRRRDTRCLTEWTVRGAATIFHQRRRRMDNSSTTGRSSTATQHVSRRALLQRSALLGLGAPLVGATATACGTREGTDGDGSGQDGGQITMAINESPWLAAYQALAAAYTDETGVEVTLRAFPPDNLHTKEFNAVQNNSGEFDIFTMFGTWYGSFFDGGFIEPFNKIDSSFSLDDQVITYDDLIKWDPEAG